MLIRRRSGGGAVVVEPDAQIWLDIYVPASDPLYSIDVSRASGFVGELWRRALEDLLPVSDRLEVVAGPLVSSRWSRAWCFSGLGPGEVTLNGRKLVGLSQRRNKAGAWFFTMACTVVDPVRDASFIAGSPLERAELAVALALTHAPLRVDSEVVTDRLRRHLELI